MKKRVEKKSKNAFKFINKNYLLFLAVVIIAILLFVSIFKENSASLLIMGKNIFQDTLEGEQPSGFGGAEPNAEDNTPKTITECATLTSPNTIYYLENNISGSISIQEIDSIYDDDFTEACIEIDADNITLDCQGHTINSSQIDIFFKEKDNIVIKNCNLISPFHELVYYAGYEAPTYYPNIRYSNSTNNFVLINNNLNGGGILNYLPNSTRPWSENLTIYNNTLVNGMFDITYFKNINVSGNTIETSSKRGIDLVGIQNGEVSDNFITSYANGTYDGGAIYSYGTDVAIKRNTLIMKGTDSLTPGRCLAAIGYRASSIPIISENNIKLYGNSSCGIMSSWWGEPINNLIIRDNIIEIYGNKSQGIYLRGIHENIDLINNTIAFFNKPYNSEYITSTYPENIYFESNNFIHEDGNDVRNINGILSDSIGLTMGRYGNRLFFSRVYYDRTEYINYPRVELLEPVSTNFFNVSTIIMGNTTINIDINNNFWINESALVVFFNSNELEFIQKIPFYEDSPCSLDICIELSDQNTYVFNMTHLTSNFGIGEACGSRISCVNLLILEKQDLTSLDITKREDVSLNSGGASINLVDESFWDYSTLRIIFYDTDSFGLINRIPFVNNQTCILPMCGEVQDLDTYIYDINLTYVYLNNISLIDLSIGEGCGDNNCETPNENCSSCEIDCGRCLLSSQCGDNNCDSGENETSCPEDCVINEEPPAPTPVSSSGGGGGGGGNPSKYYDNLCKPTIWRCEEWPAECKWSLKTRICTSNCKTQKEEYFTCPSSSIEAGEQEENTPIIEQEFFITKLPGWLLVLIGIILAIIILLIIFYLISRFSNKEHHQGHNKEHHQGHNKEHNK